MQTWFYPAPLPAGSLANASPPGASALALESGCVCVGGGASLSRRPAGEPSHEAPTQSLVFQTRAARASRRDRLTAWPAGRNRFSARSS